MSSLMDWSGKLLAGEVPPPPIMRLLGITAKRIEPGHTVFEVEVDERHHNPLGTLHGGIYCDLADVAMGMAFGTTLPDNEYATTVELKINFLRAVRHGVLTAEARVIKSGRTLGYIECDLKDDQDRLVARASCTCMRLQRDAQAAAGSP